MACIGGAQKRTNNGSGSTLDLHKNSGGNSEDAGAATEPVSLDQSDVGVAASASQTFQRQSDFARCEADYQTYWPKYLIMQSGDSSKNLTDISFFVMKKAIICLTGESTKVKKLYSSGNLLIEVDLQLYAETLLNLTQINIAPLNISVRVTPHKTLNSCTGVLFAPSYKKENVEDILEELKSQGVTQVARFKPGNDGRISPLLKLTFAFAKLPTHVAICQERFQVKTFYHNPTRCFKCQKYGHSA